MSSFNKALLPKIYRKPDLMKLTAFDKAIVGWKMLVTYKFLEVTGARRGLNELLEKAHRRR